VTERFNEVTKLVVDCVRLMTDITKMHFVKK